MEAQATLQTVDECRKPWGGFTASLACVTASESSLRLWVNLHVTNDVHNLTEFPGPRNAAVTPVHSHVTSFLFRAHLTYLKMAQDVRPACLVPIGLPGDLAVTLADAYGR